jgi:hypothetical protein
MNSRRLMIAGNDEACTSVALKVFLQGNEKPKLFLG